MDAKLSTDGLIRIGELSKRAGVARGTIQHYVREGLLPKPVKTHRNMAYYHPDCVERIRVIKELQSRSRLPLDQIRDLLGDRSGTQALARAVVQAQEAALDAVTPAARGAQLTRSEAAEHFGLTDEFMDELLEHQLVHLRDGGFTGADLEVLATLAKLNRQGFNAGSGFRVSDLLMYRDALQKLLEQEVQSFMRVVFEEGGSALTPELAREAVQGATLLLVALRKKSIADYLSAALGEVPEELRH